MCRSDGVDARRKNGHPRGVAHRGSPSSECMRQVAEHWGVKKTHAIPFELGAMLRNEAVAKNLWAGTRLPPRALIAAGMLAALVGAVRQ